MCILDLEWLGENGGGLCPLRECAVCGPVGTREFLWDLRRDLCFGAEAWKQGKQSEARGVFTALRPERQLPLSNQRMPGCRHSLCSSAHVTKGTRFDQKGQRKEDNSVVPRKPLLLAAQPQPATLSPPWQKNKGRVRDQIWRCFVLTDEGLRRGFLSNTPPQRIRQSLCRPGQTTWASEEDWCQAQERQSVACELQRP